MKISKRFIHDYIMMLSLTFIILRPQCFISLDNRSVYVFFLVDIIVLAWLIFIKRVLYVNKFVIAILIYYLYDLVNTFIQNSIALKTTIFSFVSTFVATYVVVFTIRNCGIGHTMKYLSYSVSTLLWITYIGMEIFPEGIAQVSPRKNLVTAIHFLGQANQLTIYIMLSIILLISVYLMKIRMGKLYYFLAWMVIPLITFNKTGDFSMTGAVGLLIVIAGLLLFKFFPGAFHKLQSPVATILLVIVIFIFLTRILTLQPVVIFITDVLGKDVTLSERTTIWEQVYLVLADMKNFIFGLGETPGGAYIKIWTGNIFSAHNLILQTCLIGGICLLGILVYIFVESIKKLEKINDVDARAGISIPLFAFCVVNLFEVYQTAIVFLCLFIFYIIGDELNGSSDNKY